MKRHGKYIIKYEKTVNLLTTDCFISLGIKNQCCNMKSVERQNKSKVGLKPFNNEYKD